jgi:RimJ/RimL family protein N-acetyltransferase
VSATAGKSPRTSGSRSGSRSRSQGGGVAAAATAQAIELAQRDDEHRFMHAFPNIYNAPSNAICRKPGFDLLKACEFEFPKGHFMTCNDWRLDLRAE